MNIPVIQIWFSLLFEFGGVAAGDNTVALEVGEVSVAVVSYVIFSLHDVYLAHCVFGEVEVELAGHGCGIGAVFSEYAHLLVVGEGGRGEDTDNHERDEERNEGEAVVGEKYFYGFWHLYSPFRFSIFF